MSYLILIVIPLVLLILFLVLVGVEARSGKRLFAARRYVLDTRASRAAFVFRHVDWGAFTADITRSLGERALHDIAHGSLLAVRSLERFLTRVVRSLRVRRGEQAPELTVPASERSRIGSAMRTIRESARRSRKAISDSLHR